MNRASTIAVLFLGLLAQSLGCASDDHKTGGQLSGCPAGSIEGADGKCAPVGIQGCAEIFMEGDGLCHPSMAKCEGQAGTIPAFDTGCAPVGIQGCAEVFMEGDGLCHPSMAKCEGQAGTIPAFDTGCVPVGIQGCAAVFMEADGLCHPTMANCPTGTFAVPQEGCAPIDGPSGCGAGTWGSIQDGADTVWVDPSATVSGDGSKASPVKTIAEALAKVVTGGRIALAAGTYDEPIPIAKPMTIEGRCPSMVRVQGTGTAGPDSFVVWVNAAKGVTLRGLQIGGAGAGVVATGGSTLMLAGVHVQGATGAGVVAQGSGTDVSMTRGWIEGTLPKGDGTFGHAVDAAFGATLSIADSALTANHYVGVYAGGSGTDVVVTDSVIEGTLPEQSSKQFGGGAVAEYGAVLTIVDSAVVANHERGLAAFDHPTKVALTRILVEGTLPSAVDAEAGLGVHVAAGAEVTLDGAAILGNRTEGVFVDGAGAEVTATGSLIQGTMPQESDGKYGDGVAVQHGAHANVTGSAVIGNHAFGMIVKGAKTDLTATGDLVEQQGYMGLAVVSGATLELGGSALVANQVVGLWIADAGTEATSTGSLIAGTLSEARTGKAGRGVDVTDGGRATLTGNALLANRDTGLSVQLTGSTATAMGNLVAGTLPRESDDRFGRGVVVDRGATLVLEANAIVNNHEVGISAVGQGTVLTATRSLVEGTLPQVSDKRFGRGVSVEQGALATLDGCAIVDNQDAGVYVSLSGATIEATVVRGTAPIADGRFGDGIAVKGGKIAIQDVEVAHNARAGISAFGAHIVITGGAITCNAFDLEGEPLVSLLFPLGTVGFSFDGSTGWRCSRRVPAACTVLDDCHVETTGIEPPPELPPADPLPH